MLKQIFLGTAMLAVAATAASAADLPTTTPNYYAPVPVYNWTGFYAGGILGVAGANFNNNFAVGPGPTDEAAGFTIGAQVGYNYQFAPSWALGIEADVSFQDIEGSSANGSFEEDWMATLRARGGYTFSRYFVYATVGVAFTHKESTVATVGSGDDTVAGLAAGFGVEGKFNNRWSAKLEYLYVDVPDDGFSAGTATVVGGSDNHIARVGVNYHF